MSAMRPDETRYLFIDGGYLRGVLRELSRRLFADRRLSIDIAALSSGYRKSFYYDCVPEVRSNESEEQFQARLTEYHEWVSELRSSPGVHVIEGSTSGQKKQRQKQVDVAIAVDMLTHSHRRNMSGATLLSGDLDFKPVVEALVRDGMWVTVWCEQSSASKDLYLAADELRQLSHRTVFDILNTAFTAEFPRPDEYGTSRQTDTSSYALRGYSEVAKSSAFLLEGPHRWEVVLQPEADPTSEQRIGHTDRAFLEYWAELDRGVTWDSRDGTI